MNNDYSTFEIEDFVADDSFKNWVFNPEATNQLFWKNYLHQYPHQADKLLAARQLLLDLRASQLMSEDTPMGGTLLADNIWENIQTQLSKNRKPIIFRPLFVSVAASVALLIGCWFGYRFFSHDFSEKSLLANNSAKQEIEEINRTGNVMRIHLSDGSVVSLEKNSHLQYAQDFNKKTRIVHLQGEAYFEITKNPEKPFIVYANEVVTKVLGTSFRVKAYEYDKNVTVSVRTGRVSVLSLKEFDLIKEKQNQTLTGLVLTPNQEAIYVREVERLNKTLVPKPVLLVPPTQKKYDFTFENTPIIEVFNRLENAYGVDIVFDEELFKNCSLTVSLEDEELFEKLKIICKTIGASYQIIDSQIVINGRGC